jgi:hypothetical protein
MDDAIAEDGDRGFVGVNQRLQLNQLKAGEVRESLNGRMEGYWKPRKVVVSRTGALTVGGDPLQLPFYLIDVAKTISSATYASNVVTITMSANHGFEIGSSGYAVVAGLTFTGTNNNGNKVLTYVSANQLSFPVAGVTAVSGTGTLSQMPINDAANANVRASCLFSDPNTNNKEYVIVALDTVAKKIDLTAVEANSLYVPENIPYPAGTALGADTDMIQVFDKVMLFREGQQALEWYPNGRPIISASSDATASPNTVVTMKVREHGLTVGTSMVIAGLTSGTPPNGTFTVATIVDQDSFTFVASGISTSTTFVTTVATMTNGFTLSPGGAYTQPQAFIVAGTNVAASNGLVTIDKNTLGNTTITKGDIIVIYETTIDEFTSIVGKEFEVFSANTTTITFYAPIGTKNSFSGNLEFGGRFSEGGGFMHQPGAPWGVHFQRRLWVPYYYDQSGAYNAVTYTDRKITDEIAVSDILDTTTFDQIENQFRISGGTADYVVAMHGFYDDALIVLNRNSIHQIKGTQGTLLDTRVTELTSEVGCLARKSVVMRANTMMFLSDDGVYGVEFLNDYNLRGAEEPISKNIQPYIDRLNKDLSNKSVGILFDNRYYLAVPLDSAPGINDARGNNSILVYNFLNGGWESLDTFGDTRFLIEDLIIGSAGVRNNLYAVTANGGLHQLEVFDGSNDTISVSNTNDVKTSAPILSKLITRGYDLETLERKRFTDSQINMQGLPSQNSEYLIEFAAEDPDNSSTIGTTTQFLDGQILQSTNPLEAETASIRCRLGGIRGYTGTMILTRTQGSAKINSIKVAGSVTNRQIISQK